jgi:hypothetical protein
VLFVSLGALSQSVNLQALRNILCPAISLHMQIKFNRVRDLDVRDASVETKYSAEVPHAVWGLSGCTAPGFTVLFPVLCWLVIKAKPELCLDGLLGGCVIDECDVDL